MSRGDFHCHLFEYQRAEGFRGGWFRPPEAVLSLSMFPGQDTTNTTELTIGFKDKYGEYWMNQMNSYDLKPPRSPNLERFAARITMAL